MDGEDLRGRRLGDRYELEEPVASGGMARVWRARDLVLGRPVAVKILHEDLAADLEMLERFRMEAVAAARLSHPAIVRVFDTGVDDSVAYIVMELFEGSTLSEVLERKGPLPPEDAVEVVGAVLQGLAHAHRAGVIHRDVKPANILVDETGVVKVTDFGIAKAAFGGGDLTTTGNLLGTAKYLAPEQVAGEPVDARADLYAAGVVLYEALTGRPPFKADNHLATATLRLSADPPRPGSLRPGIPRDLESAVMRALSRDPDERFQSAEEMEAAVARSVFRAARARPQAAAGIGDRPPSILRSWVLVPLLALLVAGLGVAGFLVYDVLTDGSGSAQGRGGEEQVPRLEIVAASDYDPEPGDGFENGDDVPLAFDGDPATGWETEGYDGADLAGLKPGVGIWFDLGRPEVVSRVRVLTGLEGWRFQIKGSDDGQSFSAPLAAPDGRRSFVAGQRTSFDLEPAEHRFFLIWVIELAASPDRYRAQVAEVDFFGGG